MSMEATIDELRVQGTLNEEIRRQILEAAEARMPRHRTSIAYRFSLAIVALVMVLLPLIYLAIIAGVGWGAWWHTTHNYGMLTASGARGKALFFVALAYLVPAIVGCVVIAFMLKPLFSRRPRVQKYFSLERRDQPYLFEFVDRLCDSVQAPRPRRIDITDDVNALASFRRGWWSLLTGNDLVLTIGLPLIAGLNLQQFSSILAHEFGHFAQGGGMRLGYIIESMNRWFARVVFERDSWDISLERWVRERDNQFVWLIELSQGAIWVTRKILEGLWRVGVLFSRRLSRQMEFDADAVATAFAGPVAHREVGARMYELSCAQSAAYSALEQAYREGRLVDDLIALVVGREQQFNSDERQRIATASKSKQTNWYDTHPSHKERLAAVERLGFPGVFQRAEPARILFQDFDSLSKDFTRQFYEERLGKAAADAKLCETSAVLAMDARQSIASREAARYIVVRWGIGNHLPLPERSLIDLRGWTVTRDMVIAQRESLMAEVENFKKGDGMISQSFKDYVNCNWPKTAQQRGLQVQLQEVPPTAIEVERLYEQGCKLTEPLEMALARRLLMSLAIRFQKPNGETLDAAGEEAWRLFTTLRRLEPLVDDLTFLRLDVVSLRNFIEGAQAMPDHPAIVTAAYAEATELLSQLTIKWTALNDVPYPFTDSAPGLTIARYGLRELPKPEQVVRIHNDINSFCDNILELRIRIAIFLCARAAEIERELGLEPLAAIPG